MYRNAIKIADLVGVPVPREYGYVVDGAQQRLDSRISEAVVSLLAAAEDSEVNPEAVLEALENADLIERPQAEVASDTSDSAALGRIAARLESLSQRLEGLEVIAQRYTRGL